MRPAPILLVTTSEDLVEEVSALAAAGGVSVAVSPSAAPDPGAWRGAALVLLGEDALEHPVPSRRPGVLVLTTGGPAGEELWRSALAAGAEQVLSVPGERATVLRRLGDVADAGERGGTCVAVVGARGGVGVSTLAAALAHRGAGSAAAAGGASASLLVDTDLLGAGLDLLVGLEGAPGLRWGDLAQARGSVRGQVLAQSLPRRDRVAVLSSGGAGGDASVRGDVVEAVLRAARPHHHAVVVDLARASGALTEAALGASDVLLVLVPPDVGSEVGARRVLEVLAPSVADVRLVLRTGLGTGASAALPAAAVADALGVPVAAVLGHDRALAEVVARGEAPWALRRGPLAAACASLGALLAPGDRAPARRDAQPAPREGLTPAPSLAPLPEAASW